MLAGMYVERDSFFHRLDPRAKLAWALMVLAASMATQFNGLKSLPVFASVVIALAVSGMGAGLAALIIFNASVFLLVTTLVWASMYALEGAPVLKLGWLVLTDVGLLVALGKFFLIINPVLAFVVFFASTKPYHVSWTLERLGVPSKLATAFVIAICLLPSMVRTAREVIDVQRARGLALDKGSIVERLSKYAPILIPLMARLIGDVWDLGMVLASRGVGYAKRRTYAFEPAWGLRDTAFSALTLAFYGVIAAWGLLL